MGTLLQILKVRFVRIRFADEQKRVNGRRLPFGSCWSQCLVLTEVPLPNGVEKCQNDERERKQSLTLFAESSDSCQAGVQQRIESWLSDPISEHIFMTIAGLHDRRTPRDGAGSVRIEKFPSD